MMLVPDAYLTAPLWKAKNDEQDFVSEIWLKIPVFTSHGEFNLKT